MVASSNLSWSSDYIGLPYTDRGRDRAGCDCWGLVRLVLREQWGIEVPSAHTDYADPDDRAAAHALFETYRGGAWLQVEPEAARAGDVVLLRRGRHACHVGILTAPRVMLHIQRGIDASIERLDGAVWAQKVDSYWRHREMEAADAA